MGILFVLVDLRPAIKHNFSTFVSQSSIYGVEEFLDPMRLACHLPQLPQQRMLCGIDFAQRRHNIRADHI